ncbi:MAG: TIGR02646 family protein [Thiomargarita sp.]|nr:TIGR02646 family protein [Thiomargarita sp.]
MRKIKKTNEPVALREWKDSLYQDLTYNDVSHIERQAIRQTCLDEQYYLCAYCCKRIVIKESHNEHVKTQMLAPNQTLDFHNIVASCNIPKQCGKAHSGSKEILLTPLMEECETELEFFISGEVEGKTIRAIESIKTLNLNNKALIKKRKIFIERLVLPDSPQELCLLDDDLLQILMEEINVPNNRKLTDYSPILQNILYHLLKK